MEVTSLDKKVIKNYNWPLLLLIIAISLFGLLMVGASTESGDVTLATLFSSHYFTRQLIFLVVGLAGMFILSLIDYNEWRHFVIPIYLFCLALLVLVIFKGHQAGGSQRWISVGFFNLQPSELAKVGLVITLSAVMAKEGRTVDSWSDLIIPFVHVALPMFVVFMQPDLGTSLVFVAITVPILFVAGMRWLHLRVLSVGGIIASVFAFLFVLKPYQKSRLIIFRDPSQDYFGDGWQIIQSKIAIGSGQFRGRGLFQGTQNHLDFLPEKHTDFIFSVVGEELGFIGAALFLLVYLLMILQILRVGMSAKDSFGRYLCIGVASMLIFQVLVNVGMTISIMPVTGIPLPLISYGGSSFLATIVGLGLVLSVSAHRDTSIF